MNFKGTILVVDDNADNVRLLYDFLHNEGYSVNIAFDGEKAVESVKASRPELIIMDIQMPNMSGYEASMQIREMNGCEDIPIIFSSAMNEIFNIEKAFDVGGVDYVTKPFNANELRRRVEIHLKNYRTNQELEKFKSRLEGIVDDRTRKLINFQNNILYIMATLAEFRDSSQKGHIERVQLTFEMLIRKLSENKTYTELSEGYIQNAIKATPLHDVGKLIVPDTILLKPGALDYKEYEVMKLHAKYGKDVVLKTFENNEDEDFIQIASDISYHHHEKWDGTGYPSKLKGEEIPLCCRILSVIDVYDALISKRVYKGPYSHSEAIKIIRSLSGTHFDPAITNVFIEHAEEVRKIVTPLMDYEEERKSIQN